MIRLFVFLASLFLVENALSQISNKQDYVWILNNDPSHDGLEAYVFDFNRMDSIPKALNQYAPTAFSGNNASICDKDGKLLFYTNGCTVADRYHHTMPNGSGINEGEFIEILRNGDCSNGYPGRQDIMILPDPNNERGYYILHRRTILEGNRYKDFNYTYVMMDENNGFGDVIEKNVTIDSTKNYFYRYLTAISHSNGVDWWIIQLLDEENKFQTYKLTRDGFEDEGTRDIPIEFGINSSGSGTANFSPDGSKYAFFNAYDNLLLYDFDRVTGELTDLKQLQIKDIDPNDILFSSVEWSSNSRFLYIAATDSLWQVDTHETNLEDGLELIDVWNGAQDPFATTFVLMALAPDCKIYMCSGSSTNTYHVINEPNKKGKDCDFIQQGIRLPFVSATATLPNFPRFRVDDDKKCDPGITSVFGDIVHYKRDLDVYPNPFVDRVTIVLPENIKGQVVVFDMQGQIVWQHRQGTYKDQVQLDLSHLPIGTYSLEFLPENNPERLIYTLVAVKVE